MKAAGHLAAILALAGALPLFPAGQEGSPTGPLTLRAAIEMARANHPAALAAEADVRAASLNVRRARAAGYLPRLALSANAGLVPEARGDIFGSPDLQTDLDGFGPFGRFSLDVTQPLTTFGRAGAAVAAAGEGAAAEGSKRDAALEDLSLHVVRAYWGVLAAEEAGDLARESGERYRELLGEIEERLGREASAVDDEDLLEAKTHELEIETAIQSGLARKETARHAFNLLLGRAADAAVSLASPSPPVFDVAAGTGAGAFAGAADARPEVRALAAALRASDAKIRLNRLESWPILYLAANFGLARAPNREDQTNPFVVDNFNYRNVGLALGLRWEPDFFGGRAEVRQAEAERAAVAARLEAVRTMAALELDRGFTEARRNAALLAAAERSLLAAKSWLRLSQENWDTGLGDAYRLLRAYRSYFELRGAVIERRYAAHVSLAELARALGETGRYVDWLERGRVALD